MKTISLSYRLALTLIAALLLGSVATASAGSNAHLLQQQKKKSSQHLLQQQKKKTAGKIMEAQVDQNTKEAEAVEEAANKKNKKEKPPFKPSKAPDLTSPFGPRQ